MEPHRTGRNEPHVPAIEPGRTLGPYLVLSTLSCSVRRTVYMGQDLALDRPVVLKVGARGTASVITEGRVLARCNHPHIVTLYGLWSQPPALILEYLVGETLNDRQARGDGLPPAAIRRRMIEILSAMETLHGQGLAHGALCADNVFVTTDQRLKLLDFRQSQGHDAPPTPADDIRAAGRLIHELLGTQTDDPLAAIARSATLGRFPTARALRRALTAGPVAAIATTSDKIVAAPITSAPRADAPLITPPRQAPVPLWRPALTWIRTQRGRWHRLGTIRRRWGMLILALVIVLLFAVRSGWPDRQAPPHVTSAHAAAVVVRPAPPAGGLPPAKPVTVAHPPSQLGAYAALAHAWGN